MKQVLLIMGCSTAILTSGCATTGAKNNTATRAIIGSAAGAALGAIGGQAIGSGAFGGAVVGAVAGGAAGAMVPGKTFEGREYYRDTRGYCYYVDRNGQPQYDGTTSC